MRKPTGQKFDSFWTSENSQIQNQLLLQQVPANLQAIEDLRWSWGKLFREAMGVGGGAGGVGVWGGGGGGGQFEPSTLLRG